jgi:RNA polymerase primary sigma factor
LTKQLLTPEEEIFLVRVIQSPKSKSNHNWAMNKLVEANQGLVHKIVSRFPIKNATCSYDDLFQEGVMGLMHGISKFDVTRGYRLSTYCYNWVLAYIRRYFQNHSRTVRVPVHMSDKQLQLNKQIEALTAELGRTPTAEEIREVNDNASHIMNVMMSNISLNAQIDEDSELEALVGENPSERLDSIVDADILLNQLKDDVSPRDYNLLVKRFGLDGDIPHTLEECAQQVGLTRARVHQVEKMCLSLMKGYAMAV